ncbi:NB-ARC domain-containing protein [Lyngbya aestuarii]|uniref:NB-ARC domain-containing protein n=1 Tax=Lyngbya aestuarii TaxID=118322 RepID=UPI00403DE1F6
MPTLKASRLGIVRIKQARNEKGWGWSIQEDDSCFIETSRLLEPDKTWLAGGPYANGVSEGTWKRFLAGRQAINAGVFKAYCEVLELDWQEIVDRRSAKITNNQQDWGKAIDISAFYGRTAELAQLEQWILEEQCRVVSISGMGGIGKTALGVKLAEQIQEEFEYLIWRSLRYAPPIQEIVADLIKFLSDGEETSLPESLDSQVSKLMEHLQKHRCLIILDDVETILRSGELAGQYREGYQDYGELIRRVGEERHQSCLVLATREKPREISSLEGTTLPVRDLKLRGLEKESAKKILETTGFSKFNYGWEELIQLYRGNPSALKIIANTIKEVFNGDISQFIAQSTLVIGDTISTLLSEQFERLSALEMEIIYWLAIENKPISLSELRIDMQFSVSSSSKLITALTSIKRRSLLDKEIITEGNEAVFTLQPVVMKYINNQFTEQVCRDVFAVVETHSIGKLGLLRSHALVKEQETSAVKEIQTRLILTRVIDGLYMTFRSVNRIEKQLNEVLSMLEGKPPQAVGYAKTNMLNLISMTEKGWQQP